jgi:signal transduction histidine kinase
MSGAEQWDEELARLRDLADLGYLVAHEINNLLNNIVLQLSIIELTAPGQSTGELQTIRRTAGNTAAKLHRFQQLSHEHLRPAELVNLNSVILEVSEGYLRNSPSPRLQLELDDRSPRVSAPPADVRRLVDLLLREATAVLDCREGTIVLQTEQLANQVRLAIEDTGPQVPEALLASLFEPFEAVRAGSDGLRLAICRAILRRLQGSIQAEERPGGGLRILIHFPSAGAC